MSNCGERKAVEKNIMCISGPESKVYLIGEVGSTQMICTYLVSQFRTQYLDTLANKYITKKVKGSQKTIIKSRS